MERKKLEEKLNAALSSSLPADNVLKEADFEPFTRDWTGRDLGRPLCVIRPTSIAHVSAAMRVAYDMRVPIVASGGRTGLVRGTHAQDALVISLDRLTNVRTIAKDLTSVTVEAGVTIAQLRQLAQERRARFPLSFGAEGSAQIGGALSTNAGGSTALRYGTARQLCLGVEVVMADGRVIDTLSPVIKNNSGPDLTQIFIGSEGTLGIITAATMRLFPAENDIASALVQVADIQQAMTLLSRVRRMAGSCLDAFEFMSKSFSERVAKKVRLPLPQPSNFVLMELTRPDDVGIGPSSDKILEGILEAALEACEIEDAVIATSLQKRQDFWAIRERSAEIAFSRKPVITTDICLPSTKITAFVAQAGEVLCRMDPGADAMTVGHLGDGNLHYTIWPQSSDTDVHCNIQNEVEALAVHLGGSFSAEHGIGLDKLDAMQRLKDPVALATMRTLKQALDPNNLLNPGRIYPQPDNISVQSKERQRTI